MGLPFSSNITASWDGPEDEPEQAAATKAVATKSSSTVAKGRRNRNGGQIANITRVGACPGVRVNTFIRILPSNLNCLIHPPYLQQPGGSPPTGAVASSCPALSWTSLCLLSPGSSRLSPCRRSPQCPHELSPDGRALASSRWLYLVLPQMAQCCFFGALRQRR